MAKRYDQAIADELKMLGEQLTCERYPHETNDEYWYRLVAIIEDALDNYEIEIARLERLRRTLKALLQPKLPCGPSPR
jgi:hypothetical protein